MPNLFPNDILLSSSGDRLLNEKEAAPLLGLSVRTLQQRRYLGQPPRFIRLPGGRAVRYRLSDLLAYVAEGEVFVS